MHASEFYTLVYLCIIHVLLLNINAVYYSSHKTVLNNQVSEHCMLLAVRYREQLPIAYYKINTLKPISEKHYMIKT